jgi:general L-amino acid transport system permease protein
MSLTRTATVDASDHERVPLWRDPAKRAIAFQAVTLGLVFMLSYWIFSNAQSNLRKQSIATGFGFLSKEAGFEIGESLIPYSAAETYFRALSAGFLNTLKVSIAGVILTIILGVFVGISRLSKNWLLARIAAGYIEVLQNIPVLLQLFFWYGLFYTSLHGPRKSFNPVPGVFFNNRGFYFPFPEYHSAYPAMAVALFAACFAGCLLHKWSRTRQDKTGQSFPVMPVALGGVVGLPLIVWLAYGMPIRLDTPHLAGFNYEGGFSFSPEFVALLLGLVLYTSAFVAEIVRAGIQSVSRGQTEAAMSIGLKPGEVLSLVILPQAMRLIIPPMTNQMLNLTKNSSLAVAIGFPDFVAVVNTSINQTGQAIEGVSLIMIVYLTISLVTSSLMNRYNKRTAIIER